MIRRWVKLPVLLSSMAAALTAGCGDGGGGSSGGGAGGSIVDGSRVDGPGGVFSCAWTSTSGSALKELTLPVSEVSGVLRGTSQNASTTCTRQKGTGGPEMIYGLRVTERSVIDLEVVSQLDTVVAIRRACDDPLSEVACSDDPQPPPQTSGVDAGIMPVPPPGFDAGFPSSTSSSRDGHVRAALDPGLYYVLVDEAEPFGVGGAFVLKVSSSAPPAQTSCAGAVPIMDGTSLSAEPLDLAAENGPNCGGVRGQPALFYQAQVPSGQRLTVRVQTVSGSQAWTPLVQIFKDCAQAACLATGRASASGDQAARYVNNGPSTETVTIAISASIVVSGATFRLDASIGDPIQNLTCQTARPLSDGLMLRGQDLSEGTISTDFRCMKIGAPSLFYKATLLKGQTVIVTTSARVGANPVLFPMFLQLHQGCDDMNCGDLRTDNFLSYTNPGPATTTVIIEVSSFLGSNVTLFDMTVSMPLPPGGVSVSPLGGLVTTEAGGQATFDVVLTSPPQSSVVVPLASSNTKEGTVSPSSLTFTPDSWDKPQKATVTGVDDDLKDGARAYTIQVLPTASDDKRYVGIDGADVAVSNLDDEPGLAIDGPDPLVTSESGAQTSFTVSLNREPTAAVRVAFSSSNEAEGKVSPPSLAFDSTTWDKPQTVTVTGVDDSAQDGAQAYKVHVGPVTSTDPQYTGVDPIDRDARNADDDFQTVAAQGVSGTLFCVQTGQVRGHAMGADEAGDLYVGMTCQSTFGGGPTDGGFTPAFDGSSMGGNAFDALPTVPAQTVLFVATSVDGGKTFGSPVNTGIPTTDFNIVGTGPGAAFVIALTNLGVVYTRTEDSGATWAAATVLSSSQSVVGLAAQGPRVAVTASTSDQGAYQLWTSEDGGRTLTAGAVLGGSPPAGVA
ncbi:MAG: large repetitive protein, partial [Myxococcales bacterium]|nr:large repetitive protein [Myxococcales bacterium]